MLTIVSLLLWMGQAHAADADAERARQHYDKAIQYYDLGRFADAIPEFEQAYQIKQDPTLLYNIAQSYRRSGDNKRALDVYKNFLRRMPDTPKRAEVESRIETLQRLVDQNASGPASPAASAPATPPTPAVAPAPNVPPPEAATAPSLASPAPDATAAATRDTAASDGRGLRVGAIVASAVGVVGIGGGVVFGLRARSLSNQVASAPVFNASDDSSGKSAERLQWVCLGVGAAALVTGGVLLLIAPSAPSTGSHVAVVPAVSPQGAGLIAEGRF